MGWGPAPQTRGFRPLPCLQDGDTVRFVVVYDTPMVRDRRSSAPPAEVPAHVLRQFPTGLHFRCLDDSLASRHLLHFHISGRGTVGGAPPAHRRIICAFSALLR